jgi:hypothetical protein
MVSKLKLTGVVLGALATACLATHRQGLRRQGAQAAGNRDSRADNASTPPRQPKTRVDAGGQTA